MTPTEDLCMEVLAARHRLGETLWTFDSRHKRTLEGLADKGLVNVTHGIVERTVRASLTDAGRAAVLDPDYAAPTPDDGLRAALDPWSVDGLRAKVNALAEECHEEVSRDGEAQPCNKLAVAARIDPTEGDPYPVCAYHARGVMVPLWYLLAARLAPSNALSEAIVAAIDALPDLPEADSTPSERAGYRWARRDAADAVRAHLAGRA